MKRDVLEQVIPNVSATIWLSDQMAIAWSSELIAIVLYLGFDEGVSYWAEVQHEVARSARRCRPRDI